MRFRIEIDIFIFLSLYFGIYYLIVWCNFQVKWCSWSLTAVATTRVILLRMCSTIFRNRILLKSFNICHSIKVPFTLSTIICYQEHLQFQCIRCTTQRSYLICPKHSQRDRDTIRMYWQWAVGRQCGIVHNVFNYQRPS